ncbi:phosphotransferase [Alteribacillus sp. YIM 98480]|uniref:phosphotransferase n=1 Tax=Alteribacillus sp. YIM 98480 TaxID=2606599 RepID=UPI00131DC561|nr:phosphotransferase [Alteribacillus sp. YIM 98480]
MKGNIEYILQRYPIHPIRVQTFDKIAKVEAEEGTFALKETQLNKHQAERFLQTLRFFEKQQMKTVVPVLRTNYGEWCSNQNELIYYLTPWGSECRGLQHETEFFKALAIFHRSTEYKETIPENVWKEQGELLKKERDQQLLKLEAMADNIEKKRYYSPFELAFLIHFPFLYRLHKDSLYWYDKWERTAAENERLRMVRCHGRPSPDHLVIDEKRNYRFINLEHTADGYPLHDIAWLYRSCMKERMWEPIQAYPWIKTYDHHFPFKAGDEALLKSQLLDETSMYPFLLRASHRTLADEHTFTFQLEERIWMLEKIKQDLDTWPDLSENKEK